MLAHVRSRSMIYNTKKNVNLLCWYYYNIHLPVKCLSIVVETWNPICIRAEKKAKREKQNVSKKVSNSTEALIKIRRK